MTQPPKSMDDKTTEDKPPKSQVAGILLFEKGVVLGEKLGHLFKLLTPVAVILGVYLISDFTRRAGVPFPPFDGSLLTFLAIIVIALIGIAFGVICIPLLPLITVSDKSVREYLRPSGGEKWLYVKRYISLFISFLFGFISWPMIIVVCTSIDAKLATNPEIFLHLSFYSVALIFSLIALLLGGVISYYLQQLSIFRSDSDIRNLRSFLGAAISSSLLSYCWSLGTFVLILALGLRRQLISDDASVWVLLIPVVLIILWHALVITLTAWELWNAVWFGTTGFVLLILTLLFGAEFCPTALRLLDLGGGTPISMVARVVDDGSPTPVVKAIDGCLVLWMGNQLTVQRPTNSKDKISACHHYPLTRVVKDGAVIPTVTDTINRQDVLDILAVGRYR